MKNIKTEKMNAEERVIKTLNHEEPDKVPSFEIEITNDSLRKACGFSPNDSQYGLKILKNLPFKNRILKYFLRNKKIIKSAFKDSYQLRKKLNIDIGLSVMTLLPEKILKFKEDKTRLGFIDEYGRIMKFEQYKDGTFILGYQGGYFESLDDFESFPKPDPNSEARIVAFEAGKEIQKELNEEIFSIPFIGGAILEGAWQGFGFERFSRFLAKKEFCDKIFNTRGEFCLELVKILAENQAKVVMLGDDFGFKNGLLMSPRYFKKYVFPWLKRICKAAHKRDCKILLHSDGDISEIFEDIINCGIDGIHPIEPTTANDNFTIFNLNDQFGENISFIGNVPPNLLVNGSFKEIETYSKKLIRRLAPGGGYIFGSGHSINPAITVDRFLHMQKIKEKYGKYPIKSNLI
jgi:uroporphyrinogen decarboxylase